MRRAINLLLAGCVAALVWVCYRSIAEPMAFDKERQAREECVKRRLNDIWKAQEAYRATHRGGYAPSFDSLILFLRQADSLRICRTCPDSLRYIPCGQRRELELTTFGSYPAPADGVAVYGYEIKVPYRMYLHGLDPQRIEELERNDMEAGRFPGLTVGASQPTRLTGQANE